MKKFTTFFTIIILCSFALNYIHAQNVLVAGAVSGNGNYLTLSAAFSALNGGAQTGANISITISANTTEPSAGAILNAGTWSSVLIQPQSGGAKTISGSPNPGFPLIDFNGSDNVTINGSNNLTISNSTIASFSLTSTICFRSDATNNVVTTCTVLGSTASNAFTPCGTILFGAGLTTGNDNNTISYCQIGPAGGNRPNRAVCSIGSTSSTAVFNSNVTITNCNIYDYFYATAYSTGVYLGDGSTDFTVSNNRFYQTAAITQTTGAQHSGIWIANTQGNNFLISGNTIGYASSTGTGTYPFTGTTNSVLVPIFLSVGTTTTTNVRGNTIAGISMSGLLSGTGINSPFRGIHVASGLTAVGNLFQSPNIIGNLSSNGSINFSSSSSSDADVNGIYNSGTSSWSSNNNNIGGITASNSSTGASNIYCLRHTTGLNWTCDFNTIGGLNANSIQSTSSSPNSVVSGINNSNSPSTMTNNIVRNLTTAGGTNVQAFASVSGIVVNASSSNHTVSRNTIHSLSNNNNSSSTTLTGIFYRCSSGPNIVSRNFIHSFSAASNTATINGFQLNSASSFTLQNNMVRLGIDANGSSVNAGCAINGINYESGSSNVNFYFNSVFIGGNPTAGNRNTSAFISSSLIFARQNNIFYNNRSNNGSTGKHYSIMTNSGSSIFSDNNIMFADGIGGVLGFYNSADQITLSDWRIATGRDSLSISANPWFANPFGSSFFVNLHVNSNTPGEGRGVNVFSVSDDFDGEFRSSLTPIDIGADAGNFQPNVPLAGNYTVGLSLFNSIAGKNITFEKVIEKVVMNTDNNGANEILEEVEVETFIPIENGKVYTGPLNIKRSEYPNLPEEAMLGLYASITSAINDLNLRGASGPVRFLLTDASYTSETFPIVINPWIGASSVNTLTIKPNIGVVPSITANNSTAVFDINNGDYFIVDGSNTNGGSTKDLTLSNSNTSGAAIRFINEAKNDTVKNCILKGVTTSNTNGVVFFSRTSGFTGNDNIVIFNNDIAKGATNPVTGIYNFGLGVSSNSKNSGNKIINNRIFDFENYGIRDSGNSAGTVYEGNEIFQMATQTNFQVGFKVFGTNIEGFIFRKNNIHDLKTTSNTHIYGIELAHIQPGHFGEISNNFISILETAPGNVKGIFDTSATNENYNIYFNSIFVGGLVTGASNSESYYRSIASTTNLKNNILVNTRSGGTGKHYGIRTISPLTSFSSNYNDIFVLNVSGNIFGRDDANDRLNLAAWQTATGKDSNSISGSPLFVSSTNLHIDSTFTSPVSNAGTRIAGITTDIDNNTRDTLSPDIGADEFSVQTIKKLTLTMFIQGFYNANTNITISDTARVYLRNASSPFSIVDSAKAKLDSNGTAIFDFPNAINGVNYYLHLKHRNSIETWSDSAVSFTNSLLTFDFTPAASQAFGNNMKQVDTSPVRFAIYGGDVNQDGIVDGTDASLVDNDAFNFVTGYVTTDVNGDDIVDGSDAAIVDNNATNFVAKITPL